MRPAIIARTLLFLSAVFFVMPRLGEAQPKGRSHRAAAERTANFESARRGEGSAKNSEERAPPTAGADEGAEDDREGALEERAPDAKEREDTAGESELDTKEESAERHDASDALHWRAPLIEGGLEFGFIRRQLRYRDDLFDHLPDYALAAAPSIAWQLTIFPLARLKGERRALNPLRGLGVRAFYQRDFIRASSREGLNFRTYSAAIDIELRYALSLRRLRVDAGLGYIRRTFAIDAARAIPDIDNLARIPNVRYQGLILAGGAAFRISRLFSVGGQGAYFFLFDSGPIAGPLYFPKDHAGAFELGTYLGLHVLEFLELRAAAELLRVHHRFDPAPGDRYIVGGAADRFSRFYLGAYIAY